MSISYLRLKKIAYFCLLLPSLIFVVGFLRWYIAYPIAIICILAYIAILLDIRKEKKLYEEQVIHIKPINLIIIVAIATLWCYLSGLGNFYYQSGDWCARNAIFRDLIRFDWPVEYSSKETILVYYIGYWLPSALIGKIFYSTTGSLDLAWNIGNVFLWIWSAVCLVIIILMLLVFLNAKSSKRVWTAVAVFIGFSGLDIVGTLICNTWGTPLPDHIERWTVFQFSSMATCLGWVFNQAVFSWLATICFLSEKKVRNYAFIIVCALTSAPLPCIGLGIYMIAIATIKLWDAFKGKQIKGFFGDVFTFQNVALTLTMLPIYL